MSFGFLSVGLQSLKYFSNLDISSPARGFTTLLIIAGKSEVQLEHHSLQGHVVYFGLNLFQGWNLFQTDLACFVFRQQKGRQATFNNPAVKV